MGRAKRISLLIVGLCFLSALTAHADPDPPPSPAAGAVAEPAPPEAEPAPPDPARLIETGPLPPLPPQRQTTLLRNPAMRRAGVVLVILGIVSAGAGVALTSTAATATSLDPVTRLELRNIGLAFWGGCAGLIATGLPLWLLGSRPALPNQYSLRYIPRVLVGPRGALLSWNF